MEISKGSWHYRLATSYSNLTDWDLNNNKVNFCQYSRKVARGFSMALFLVFLGVVVAGSWLNIAVPAYHWLFLDAPWVWLFDPSIDPAAPGMAFSDRLLVAYAIFTMIALFAQAVIAFLVGCAILGDLWSSVFPKRIPDNDHLPKGFFGTAYDSWKKKYCPIVTMKRGDE